MNRETYYTLLGLGKKGSTNQYVPINLVFNTGSTPYTGFGTQSGAQNTSNTNYFTVYYGGGPFNTGVIVYETATGASNPSLSFNDGNSHWYQTPGGSFWLEPNGDGTWTVRDFVAAAPANPTYTCTTYEFTANQGSSGTAQWLNCASGQWMSQFLNAGEAYTVCARTSSPRGLPYTTMATCSSAASIYSYSRLLDVRKNNCQCGQHGNTITFTRTYTSIYSQDDAYNASLKDTTYLEDAQIYANANATCSLNTIVIPNVLVTGNGNVWRLYENNGDGNVEMSYGCYADMEVRVYAINGVLEYYSKGIYSPWNFYSTITGQTIPDGTHSYQIKMMDGTNREYSGNLAITSYNPNP